MSFNRERKDKLCLELQKVIVKYLTEQEAAGLTMAEALTDILYSLSQVSAQHLHAIIVTGKSTREHLEEGIKLIQDNIEKLALKMFDDHGGADDTQDSSLN